MSFRLKTALLLSVLIFSIIGCSHEKKIEKRASGFDDFIVQYNAYIRRWLNNEKALIQEEITAEEASLAELSDEKKKATLEATLKQLKRTLKKTKTRIADGDFFQTRDISEIPSDLVWEDGMEQEEIGDPAAKKGGIIRREIPLFPPTLRGFGPNSNNGLRGTFHDEIEITLVDLHPKTGEIIPGIAKEWAISKDGRTVYYRLHQEATFSDGSPVKTRDFLFGAYIRISDNVVNPFLKQYFRESVSTISVYDDYTLSVTLPEPKILMPYFTDVMIPAASHFYQDYGPDFAERYQWKYAPTTGAYKVLDEDIVKGVSIVQTRVKGWWAKDKKFYRYRYNPDRIKHLVVRDPSKGFELFRAGELDYFYLNDPKLWYEKSVIEPVFKGYIERATFYNQFPAIPWGLYINVSRPLLEERDVRIGVHHAMNWQKVIDVIFRGDLKRLNALNEGYGIYSDPSIKARPFSISKARKAFADAGFTTIGEDGVLERADGTRLSISVSYPAEPTADQMLSILREDALACGLDLRLDSNERVLNYKKVMQKQYDMAFRGWSVMLPTPRYYEFLHSSNARDKNGNLKPNTNNIHAWSRKDTDDLTEAERSARTKEELALVSKKLQNIVHDEAIFVPGYVRDFMRVGSWRWLRWPDSEETRFCPPLVDEPHEIHVHWIDEDMKRETLKAKRLHKTFPEVNRVIDTYRPTPSESEEKTKLKEEAE